MSMFSKLFAGAPFESPEGGFIREFIMSIMLFCGAAAFEGFVALKKELLSHTKAPKFSLPNF